MKSEIPRVIAADLTRLPGAEVSTAANGNAADYDVYESRFAFESRRGEGWTRRRVVGPRLRHRRRAHRPRRAAEIRRAAALRGRSGDLIAGAANAAKCCPGRLSMF
ncbi:hypothetical protein [Aromatoleum sp.]|uniref:hypothetical protein n=1 Tax=Aromatoleum sp. TaxID=2307007 RepID=UPI002FCB8D15